VEEVEQLDQGKEQEDEDLKAWRRVRRWRVAVKGRTEWNKNLQEPKVLPKPWCPCLGLQAAGVANGDISWEGYYER
jgi:hypothetical protein